MANQTFTDVARLALLRAPVATLTLTLSWTNNVRLYSRCLALTYSTHKCDYSQRRKPVNRDHHAWTAEEEKTLIEFVLENRRDNGQVTRGLYETASRKMGRGKEALRKKACLLVGEGKIPPLMDRARYKPLSISDTDAAWLAGILDGEGSIPSLERKRGDYKGDPAALGNSLRVSLVFNTDLGVINRVKDLVPYSVVLGPYKRGWARKDMYQVDVYGQRNVYVTLNRLLPYMWQTEKVKRAKDSLQKILWLASKNPCLTKHLQT